MALADQEFHLPAQYNPCGGEKESMMMRWTKTKTKQRQRQRQRHLPAQYNPCGGTWEGVKEDEMEEDKYKDTYNP